MTARKASTGSHGLEQEGIEIRASVPDEFAEILTSGALRFVAKLQREFDDRRHRLLAKRRERQKELDRGALPDFLEETRQIREADWKIAPLPDDLRDRRVEITGPPSRKMVINHD